MIYVSDMTMFVFTFRLAGWCLLVIGLVWWALAGPRRGASVQRSNLESE